MRHVLSLLILALLAVAAHAEDASSPAIPLPERVITATRVPTLAEQIPAGVTVIDRATIEARGYTTLTDALQAVPGLHAVQSGGDGGNASVFIRGTDSNHVLVLRDGVPLNDPSDPTGSFNFGVNSLADVERIEVVRGPMSGLYGSGAVGGVINLITRHGSGGPHTTATIAGGLPVQGLFGASISGSQGIFDYSAAVQSRSENGFDVTPKRESVHTGERDGFRSQLANITLGITPMEGTRFYGTFRWRTADFGLDELGSPAFDAPNYTGRDRSMLGQVGVTSKQFDGVWETSLSVAHLDTLRRYYEVLEPADPNMTSGTTRYNGRRTAIDWNNTVHLPDLGPARATALTVGVQHFEDSSSSHLNESFGGFPFASDVDAHASHTAGSVGLQTTLFGRLTLTAGLRGEGATFGGDAFTWRAGGVLALPEIWSRVKLSYGTAFVAPSLYDLFGVDSFGYVGNPNLRPERSEGGEVGWAVDVPAFGRRDGATVDVTLFENRIRDLIQVVFAPDFSSSTTQNVARARTSGVETSLTLHPLKWADAVLSWTYTDAHGDNGSNLLRRPRNQASLNVRTTPLPGLTIAPELLYISGASDFLVDDEGFQTGVGRTNAGVIFNLTVNYEVMPRVTLFVNARNLGNSHYEPASGFQMAGPSFLAGARLRY